MTKLDLVRAKAKHLTGQTGVVGTRFDNTGNGGWQIGKKIVFLDWTFLKMGETRTTPEA